MSEEEDDSLDALEYELNQMGLSVEDLQPPEDGQFDRRAMARVESARIMSRRFIERDRVKSRISAQTKVRHQLCYQSSQSPQTLLHLPTHAQDCVRKTTCTLTFSRV